ncbi:diguanylate cyclase [Novosphingobium sp. 9]|uniref:diguanylate cyclase n=1 Tax=Novosphingobium sp. 9 TaxID=2025349 RepID=UPI0021B5F270|nr:diguanylate cyclase [Novosphingobium sp. 9]
MRLATITNWAYGATVLFTFVSGTTMLLASGAQERERVAVEQRQALDEATEKLDEEVFGLTDRARQYLDSGDPTYRVLYGSELAALGPVEVRIRHIGDAGARPDELAALKDAMHFADALHDEQAEAIALHDKGNQVDARRMLFGAEYERELDRVQSLLGAFQSRLDQRTETQVVAAQDVARKWKSVSEAVLVLTGLLFLCVLYFVFKRRVLHPVVKLSDVVNRLAAQDYAVEPPALGQIDEIGDMAQAIRIFRENGLERQKLEIERENDRAIRDLLARMTQRMQGCDTLPDLKEVVRRFVPEIAPGLAGALYLLDEARGVVTEGCAWLEPQRSRTEFAPLACWALRRGLPHRPAGAQIDVPCGHIQIGDAAVPDTLCLPLTAHREVLGLLYFEPRDGTEIGAITAETYLRMLAETIGLALGNLRLRDTLRAMAMADPLTGLANRRRLDEVLEVRAVEAEKLGQPLSCVMVDVDHFKRINDTHGHETGDRVLREISAVLTHATREDGLAFRHGGEEFLLLLPGLDADQAAARAEEIRARIAELHFEVGGNAIGPVTVSAGVASTPLHCPADRLLQTADAALYRAKAAGRDRVSVAARRKGLSVA